MYYFHFLRFSVNMCELYSPSLNTSLPFPENISWLRPY